MSSSCKLKKKLDMTVSFSKLKNELLIEDGSLVKKNVNKTLVVALAINFCLAITFFSLFIAYINSEKGS